ncbi:MULTISPECIES: hypothetical protein [Vibrio]|uniref:hypothetical protein n=1 Tax=Vibrio TaxID=662 RepID=UPI000C840FC6|nr:hypothetical protein [Vibrio breoganii]PMG96030.1 hypothetical protein BCU79_09085 [Vibrio breoganii]
MLKPIKKVLEDTESSHCEITHVELLREVGSLDQVQREKLKDEQYQEAAEQSLKSIRKKMRKHEQTRLVSQEEALLEQSDKERVRRERLKQLGGSNE